MNDENKIMKTLLAWKEKCGYWSLPGWITQVGLCPVSPGTLHAGQCQRGPRPAQQRAGNTASLSPGWAPIADLSRWQQRVERSWKHAYFTRFFFSLPFDGAQCCLHLGYGLTVDNMSHGRCASLFFFPMAFYHSLILLILASLKPRVWMFFSAHWNQTWKHFNQCKSLKPLFIHPGKAFTRYADNDWLYYVYLLVISPFAIDSISRFPGARFNFQPQ